MNQAERANSAEKGLASFIETMKMAAERLKRNFEVLEVDGDGVEINLDGYHFTLSWGETGRPSIGRFVWVIQYNLCIWHQTHGDRWNPPESIDTLLVTSQCLNDCVRTAFETVAKDEIRQALENVDEIQMAAQQLEQV